MKKESAYFIIAAIVALGIIIIYYAGGGPTGYAIFEQYTNESDCVAAGYTWENITEQNCTIEVTYINETYDCEPCLEYEDINGTQGDCINWTSCTGETAVEEEVCEDVIVGGQCVGEICDSDNLNLCEDETSCTDATGYWYDETCNVEEEPSCSNDLSLCLDESNCTDAGGYWYGEEGEEICNEYECATDEQCDSGYECVSGSCYKIEVTPASDEPAPETDEPAPEIQEQPFVPTVSIGANNIANVNLAPGESEEISWKVRNTGDLALFSCAFSSSGENSELISFEEKLVDLNSGEEVSFLFNVETSEEKEEGEYGLSVSVQCSQSSVSKSFTLEVEKRKLDLEILDAQRTRLDRVRVLYSLSELIGEEQDVELHFSLVDAENQEIVSVSENKTIGADTSKEFRINIPVNESLEGNLTLAVAFNSEIYSSSVREPITLGAPIGGFAIFEDIGTGGFVALIVVVLVLVFLFIAVRRMRKKKKTLGNVFSGKKE